MVEVGFSMHSAKREQYFWGIVSLTCIIVHPMLAERARGSPSAPVLPSVLTEMG